MMPEPFSVTLSVFATLAFLDLARQGGQALLKYMEAYKETPAEITTALTRIALIDHSIKLWKRIWLIESDTHEEYPTFLWGDGWQHIENEIGMIEDISKEIRRRIAPHIQYEEERVSDSSPNIQDQGTLGPAAVQRMVMQRRDKIIHILLHTKELKEHFKELPARLDRLHRNCEYEYLQKHDADRSMPNSTRRDEATSQMLVSQALKSRQTSCALYEQSLLAVEGDVELELSLLKWRAENGNPRPFNAGIPDSLCFYLTIPSATMQSMLRPLSDTEEMSAAPVQNVSSLLEVLIEGTTKIPTEHKGSFREACLDLLHKQSCYFRTVDEGGATSNPLAFKSWISSDKVGESERVESTLRDLLSDPAFSIVDREQNLSTTERIEIAYRIAECTLLLLETPWLSSLGSSNITRAHAAHLASRYRLLVKHEDGGMNRHEAQMLLVGHLLRELALGTNIGPFDRDKDLALVSREFGKEYEHALDFCYNYKSYPSLRPPNPSARNRERLTPEATLSAFFKEVFVP